MSLWKACASATLFRLASTATLVTVAPDGEAKPSAELFERFVQDHKRTYPPGSTEYAERRSLFHRRLATVEEVNRRPERLWTASINHFADRTDEELKAYRGWKRSGAPEKSEHASSFLEVEKRTFPTTFDWLNLTKAYAIPQQGSCGSCWAVTTAAVMDAHMDIWQKKPQTFSAQELVSCVANPQKCGGSGGCDGATVELGMKWIMARGLSTAKQTPYLAKDTKCGKTTLDSVQDENGNQVSGRGKVVTGASLGMTGWETLPSNKEAPLLAALIDKGPVAVSVAAGSWFLYSSGIFNDCSKDCVVDHAVTMYGIGKKGSHHYWLIRNSWGHSWGERGFIRLRRTTNEDSVCGTDNNPQEGTGCVGGPATVTVCGTCGVLYDSVVPHFNKKGKVAGTAVMEEEHDQEIDSEPIDEPDASKITPDTRLFRREHRHED